MQSYLKTKPVWMQLLLFLGIAAGCFLIFSAIGVMILSKLTGISVLEIADTSKWDTGKAGMITFIRGMLVIQFLGLFVIPSLLFAMLSDPQPAQYLGLQPPEKAVYWVLGVASLLIAIPLVEYTGLLNRNIHFGGLQKWAQSMEDEAAKQIAFMLGRNSTSELLLNIIFIAAFAGVGEELLFRGVLQRLFIKGTKNAWLGIIITAFLFSFFHFQFFGFLPRLLLGILLGALYWYSGSLWTAILAHFIYDAFFIVLVYFQPQMIENTEASLIGKSYLAVTALASALIVGILVWLMKRNSVSNYKAVYASDNPPPSEHNFTF